MDNGPPKDVPADELWTKLCQTELPHEVVDFPRNDAKTGKPLGQIAIRPLTQGEIIIAKAEATRYARAAIKEKFDAVERVEGYAQVFEDACATEMVCRFCRRTENHHVPVFARASDVRERLTSDEVSVLVNQYALVQHRYGPIVSGMTTEDYEAWIKRLHDGGSATPLAFLSWEQRTDLLMHSVSQLVALRTLNSSVGKQQDAITSSDSSE